MKYLIRFVLAGALLLLAACEKRGVDPEVLLYPSSEHGFQLRIAYYKTVDAPSSNHSPSFSFKKAKRYYYDWLYFSGEGSIPGEKILFSSEILASDEGYRSNPDLPDHKSSNDPSYYRDFPDNPKRPVKGFIRLEGDSVLINIRLANRVDYGKKKRWIPYQFNGKYQLLRRD